MDILLVRRVDAVGLAKTIGKLVPDGMRLLGLREIMLKAPSLEEQIRASIYHVEITNASLGLTEAAIAEKLKEFAERPEFVVEVAKKDRWKEVDLKQSISEIAFTPRLGLTVAIRHVPGLFVKAHQAAGAILGQPLELGRDLRINRAGFEMDD